jgi:hypothetical protein
MNTHSLVIWRLLAAAGIFYLSGCGDDPTRGTTQVAGQVVQRQSRQPVGGGTVRVYRASSRGGYDPVGDPRPCDAQGRFAFAFDAEQKAGYLLLAEAPPGYVTDWADAPALTAGRKNTGLVVPVLAPAWVRLVLVDEPPKSRSIVHVQGYSGSGETLRYPRDTAFTRPILADFKLSIAWFIYEPGQPDRQSYQQVQATPLDTVTVRIPF